MLVATLLLLACGPDPDAPPPQPEGDFRVIAVQTSDATIDGSDVITGAYAGCRWGQQTFGFTAESVSIEVSVLCPTTAENAMGCQARVEAEASWDGARGVFTVPRRTAARARFRGLEEGKQPTEMAACKAVIESGEYAIARIYNGQWKWEVRTPDGAVHRMVDADRRPDFVNAMLAMREAK